MGILFLLSLMTVTLHSGNCADGLKFQITPPLPSFHGRGQFLAKLYVSIQKSRTKSSSPSAHHHEVKFITGDTAIGKTQATRKYIEKYGSTYDHLIWLNGADGPQALMSSLLDLASTPQLSHLYDPSLLLFHRHSHTILDHPLNNTIVREIFSKMYSHIRNGSTLLVLDDLFISNEEHESRESFLHNFLPPLSPPVGLSTPAAAAAAVAPIILVIAKKFDAKWGGLCDDIELFPISGWTSPEQVEYIIENIGFLNDFEKDEEARKDAKELGHLLEGSPLAIRLATAYCKETGMSMSNYTHMHKVMNPVVAEEAGEFEKSQRHDPITATWLMTRHELEDMDDEGTIAIQMIQILAILQRCEDTPRNLLFTLVQLEGWQRGEEGDDNGRQSHLFHHALELMEHFLLVHKTRGKTEEEIVHCQLQIARVVRHNMKGEQRSKLKLMVLNSLNNYLENIFKKDGATVEKEGEYKYSTRFLEKFLEFRPRYSDRTIEKENRDEDEWDQGSLMELKLKLVLVYEKMRDFDKSIELIERMMGEVEYLLKGKDEKGMAEEIRKIFGYLDDKRSEEDVLEMMEEALKDPMEIRKRMKVMRKVVEKVSSCSERRFGESHGVTIKLWEKLVRLYEREEKYGEAKRVLGKICEEYKKREGSEGDEGKVMCDQKLVELEDLSNGKKKKSTKEEKNKIVEKNSKNGTRKEGQKKGKAKTKKGGGKGKQKKGGGKGKKKVSRQPKVEL